MAFELRKYLSRAAPMPLLNWWRRHRSARVNREYADMDCERIFSRIYEKAEWGGAPHGPWSSGSGSSEYAADKYVHEVRQFIMENGIRSMVDIGCGDFRVSERLIEGLGIEYTGVDVVPELIDHNEHKFGGPNIQFLNIDVTEAVPPSADLAVIRQVFQHLSNEQIHAVLRNTDHYCWRIVTEHVAKGPSVVPNIDHPAGPGIRVANKSGVFLEASPFGYSVEELIETWMPYHHHDAVLRTSIIRRRESV